MMEPPQKSGNINATPALSAVRKPEREAAKRHSGDKS